MNRSEGDEPDRLQSGTDHFGPTESADALLPRAPRKPRRAKADRGLPGDEELSRLAEAYLERQRKHWPEIVKAGLLPAPTPSVLHAMVQDFKERHRTGHADIGSVKPFLRHCGKLAGSYNRYSCENSSSTSALDQMVNALDKAHSEGRFIVWQYVFADYSVTGLDPSRQGYNSFKSVLTEETHLIETTYIDDFTRAGRDEIEWWKLAALSKRLQKRMIGASDGFDLSNSHSDVLITMFGLVSRMFVTGLREKVRRGMRGAARRRTCLGKLPLGFTRRPHRDKSGEIVLGPDGLPIHEPCIDPETRDYRRLLYDLFVGRNWSTYKIVRHLNQLRVDGWNRWTERAVKQLLWSPTAIGVFIWNRTRRDYNPEQGTWVTTKNSRSEWEICYDPELAIVPLDQWRAARRRLAEMRRSSPLTGRRPSRNQTMATTLLSGTLICGYCGDELKLIRSTSKYKQFGCFNGMTGARGCELKTSKSTRIVEECLLNFLRDNILTEERVASLVRRANQFVEMEARKPLSDTGPCKADVQRIERKIAKLVRRVEDEPDESLCAGYDRRIKALQTELNALQSRIREVEARQRRPLQPLNLGTMRTYLAEFRETLAAEVPVAAEGIRRLTGPIIIRQEAIHGRKTGARWIGSFSPRLSRVLQQAAADSFGAENSLGQSEDPKPVELAIEKVPKYEQLAPTFRKLRNGGASIESIASTHGMSTAYATEILRFAESGKRPTWGPSNSRRNGRGNRTKYKEIAETVVRLRDTDRRSFAQIAKELGVSGATVRRAYDLARPEAVRLAAERGSKPQRGTYSHLGAKVYEKIRKLLLRGLSIQDTASRVGCGRSTVRRVQQTMKSESEKINP